jgi:ribosomal protein S18 acetylase RimI-like enzyme
MRLLAEPGSARAFLRQDVPLWAWPLCTLGSREWPYVRLWVDDEDRPEAGLWVFDHPSWGGSVQAFGAVDELERILQSVTLPGRAFVRILPTVRSLVTACYRFDWLEPIVRMHVTPETLIEPTQVRLVEPLGQADAGALATLYAVWPESRFQTSRLRQGYQYVGIRDGDRVVAVAEHVLAAREDGLAVVQGVLVDPAWRGRGLAAAVTAALTAKLFADGARDVVLDVRESNLPALAAYARIGYRRHVTLLAGPGSAR